METLHLTQEETRWLLDKVGPMSYWPPAGYPYSNKIGAFLPPDIDLGGGMPLRLKLQALYRKFDNTNYERLPLPVTVTDAWFLDDVLWNQPGDLRFNFLFSPDGSTARPLIVLAQQIYDILIRVHAESLPPHLRISGPSDGAEIEGAVSRAEEIYQQALRAIEQARAIKPVQDDD